MIENGGGCDDFVDRMLKSGGSSAEVVNAVKVSGRTAPAGGELWAAAGSPRDMKT